MVTTLYPNQSTFPSPHFAGETVGPFLVETPHMSGSPNRSTTSVRVLPISSPLSVKSCTIAPRDDKPPAFHVLLSNSESKRLHPQRRAAVIRAARTNGSVFVFGTLELYPSIW